jgi:uncharacterized membrane protein YphA (DoxX/SURF4 family)
MRWKFPFLTAVFLVLLRLAIGWHFFYEGYHKVHSLEVGPVQRDGRTVPPFSSGGYFSEGRGPLGEIMRHAIGDPDERLLERLDGGAKQSEMPSALAQDWETYLHRFTAHYGLDEKQQAKAQEKLEEAKKNFVKWLSAGSKAIVKTYPSGTVDITETNARRIEEYRDALHQLHDVFATELPAFGKDVEKSRLLKSKGDVQQFRKSLEADLEEQTNLFKKALTDLLTDSQRKLDAVADTETPAFLKYLDTGTAWFLFGVGATLLFGLLTRLSCVMAAGFLLLTYLNTPAFPWLPVPPNQEGSYFFISKNVIEMLALLTLATTPSGRWFGIDGILHPIGRAIFGRSRVTD